MAQNNSLTIGEVLDYLMNAETLFMTMSITDQLLNEFAERSSKFLGEICDEFKILPDQLDSKRGSILRGSGVRSFELFKTWYRERVTTDEILTPASLS